MKKIFLPFFFSFFCCIAVFGQHAQKSTIFHVGLITPLSTNGREAWDYSNIVSFNALAGISAEEKAFTFSGLATAVRYDVQGFQFAGLFNYVGNSGKGVMISGLANMVMDHYTGVQIGGLFNWLGYSGTGFQLGGIFNYSHYGYDGVQIGGILNHTDNINGGQIGGLLNMTGTVNGFQIGGLGNISENTQAAQIAGLLNISQNTRGFQLAGIGNIAWKTEAVQIGGLFNVTQNTNGFQLGGLFNVARNTQGVQIGGLFNIAKKFRGFQLGGLFSKADNVNGMQFSGLFNIAKNVRGVQFAGLVNVADRSDCPIGLINIIRHGEMGLAVTYNELGSAVLSFRSGGKVTYGILGVGYNHKITGTPYVIEGGFGAHINCTRWFRINNEVKISSFTDFRNESDFVAGYSLLPAFRIVRHFELFGGPGINYMNAGNDNAAALLSYKSLWKETGISRTKQVYVGWQAGIHVIF